MQYYPKPKNRWRQIDATLWQCFNFDVCFHFGSWHVCTVYGRTMKDGFKSAEQAMRAADNYDDTKCEVMKD